MKKKMYLVGGAVRDMLLGRSPKDVDFVVTGYTVEELKEKYGEPVGHDFPVFLGVVEGYEEYNKVEIALARKEVSTGPGYMDFEVVTGPDVNVETDLKRRDLTINAMAINVETNELVDPFGGRKDLRNGVLRAVSDKAFVEDPVRVLRLARFRARYGFRVAEHTAEMVRAHAKLLQAATPERVFLEMKKALVEENSQLFFETLRELGVLQYTFPMLEEKFEKRMQQLKQLETDDVAVKFAVVFAGVVEKYRSYYRNLDSSFYKMAKFVEKVVVAKTPQDLLNVVEGMRRLGATFSETMAVFNVVNPSNAENFAKMYAVVHMVTSQTLLAEGYTPGRKFGEMLAAERLHLFSTL